MPSRVAEVQAVGENPAGAVGHEDGEPVRNGYGDEIDSDVISDYRSMGGLGKTGDLRSSLRAGSETRAEQCACSSRRWQFFISSHRPSDRLSSRQSRAFFRFRPGCAG